MLAMKLYLNMIKLMNEKEEEEEEEEEEFDPSFLFRRLAYPQRKPNLTTFLVPGKRTQHLWYQSQKVLVWLKELGWPNRMMRFVN